MPSKVNGGGGLPNVSEPLKMFVFVLYVSMYVCMYECMYVCMYVCMYFVSLNVIHNICSDILHYAVTR